MAEQCEDCTVAWVLFAVCCIVWVFTMCYALHLRLNFKQFVKARSLSLDKCDAEVDAMPMPMPQKPEPPMCTESWTQISPTLSTTNAALQTNASVFVELIRDQQVPLDMMFVVDSSASVGQADFKKATDFLMEMVQHFEMPAVQAGIIQFNDRVPFPFKTAISGQKKQLESKIRSMTFKSGETKMAPPLSEAATMLENSSRPVQKLILVLTDGDPNDVDDVFKVVDELKKPKGDALGKVHDGIRIVFVHVGSQTTPVIYQELASAPPEKNVLHLDSFDELLAAVDKILANILEISLCVYRAKCSNPLMLSYEVVPDIDAVNGWEFFCPGWGVDMQEHKMSMHWDPRNYGAFRDHKVAPWIPKVSAVPKKTAIEEPKDEGAEIFIPQLPPPPQLSKPQTCTRETQTQAPTLVQKETQTFVPGVQEVGLQTRPQVRAQLAVGRHLPMDVVFCVSSPSSVCFVKKDHSDAGLLESKNFDMAKLFVEHLVQICEMPQAQFGLVRFENQSTVVCPMTGHRSTFLKQLRSINPSIGETKVSTALWHSHALLQTTGRSVRKAVVIVTDSELSDSRDAASAVAELREMGVSFIFVKVGNHGDAGTFQQLFFAPARSHFLKGKSDKQEDASHNAHPNCSEMHLIRVPKYSKLLNFVPSVLSRLVKVFCCVEKARAMVSDSLFEFVDFLDDNGEGLDLNVQGCFDDTSLVVPWSPAYLSIKSSSPRSRSKPIVVAESQTAIERPKSSIKSPAQPKKLTKITTFATKSQSENAAVEEERFEVQDEKGSEQRATDEEGSLATSLGSFGGSEISFGSSESSSDMFSPTLQKALTLEEESSFSTFLEKLQMPLQGPPATSLPARVTYHHHASLPPPPQIVQHAVSVPSPVSQADFQGSYGIGYLHHLAEHGAGTSPVGSQLPPPPQIVQHVVSVPSPLSQADFQGSYGIGYPLHHLAEHGAGMSPVGSPPTGPMSPEHPYWTPSWYPRCLQY